MSSNRKKFHHYIHDGYIRAWREKDTDTIYIYNVQNKKVYQKSGRDIGGETGFNIFSFDSTVVDLLLFTFGNRKGFEDSIIYRLMVDLITSMRNSDYPNKTDNWLEDFYGNFESGISFALLRAADGKSLIKKNNTQTFDALVLFFCLQFFRTPKIRRIFSDHMESPHFGSTKLDAQQKKEYIKMHLVVEALRMASDFLDNGCRIQLRDVSGQTKFATCDAPAIANGGALRHVKEIKGWVPLSPDLLMEVDQVGVGKRSEIRHGITAEEVHARNLHLIKNAEKEVLFCAENHRKQYIEQMNCSQEN